MPIKYAPRLSLITAPFSPASTSTSPTAALRRLGAPSSSPLARRALSDTSRTGQAARSGACLPSPAAAVVPGAASLSQTSVANAGANAASNAASSASTSPDLEEIARSTPGTSLYQSFKYDPAGEHPYPLWWLDPEGPLYSWVLALARNASSVLNNMHDTAGLPWWATILLAGAMARIAITPFTIYSLRNSARAADARDDLAAVQRSFVRANAALGKSAPPADKVKLLLLTQRAAVAALHKAKCYPLRSLAMPLLQVPIAVAGVLGARHAVLLGDASFEREGALWFTDLTVPDPMYVLPVLSLGLGYASLEVIFGSRQRSGKAATSGAAYLMGAGIGNTVKSGMQMMILASSPFLMDLPAGLYLLMSANSLWTMAYLSTVRSPSVYRLLTQRELPTPPTDAAATQSTVVTSASASGAAAASGNSGNGGTAASSGGTAALHGSSDSTVRSAHASSAQSHSETLEAPTAQYERAGAAAEQEVAERQRLYTTFVRSRAIADGAAQLLQLGQAADNHAPGATMTLAAAGEGITNNTAHRIPARGMHGATSVAPSGTSSSGLPPTPMVQPVSTPAAHSVGILGGAVRRSPTLPRVDASDVHRLHMSPRLLYVDSDSVDAAREKADMAVLKSSFNPKWPLLMWHANPMALQIAAGSPNVPWNRVALPEQVDRRRPGPAPGRTRSSPQAPQRPTEADGLFDRVDMDGVPFTKDQVQQLTAQFRRQWTASTALPAYKAHRSTRTPTTVFTGSIASAPLDLHPYLPRTTPVKEAASRKSAAGRSFGFSRLLASAWRGGGGGGSGSGAGGGGPAGSGGGSGDDSNSNRKEGQRRWSRSRRHADSAGAESAHQPPAPPAVDVPFAVPSARNIRRFARRMVGAREQPGALRTDPKAETQRILGFDLKEQIVAIVQDGDEAPRPRRSTALPEEVQSLLTTEEEPQHPAEEPVEADEQLQSGEDAAAALQSALDADGSAAGLGEPDIRDAVGRVTSLSVRDTGFGRLLGHGAPARGVYPDAKAEAAAAADTEASYERLLVAAKAYREASARRPAPPQRSRSGDVDGHGSLLFDRTRHALAGGSMAPLHMSGIAVAPEPLAVQGEDKKRAEALLQAISSAGLPAASDASSDATSTAAAYLDALDEGHGSKFKK